MRNDSANDDLESGFKKKLYDDLESGFKKDSWRFSKAVDQIVLTNHRHKEKHWSLSQKPSGLASYYGYSALLQTAVEAAPGMLQLYFLSVLDVSEVCCKCFVWML